ncbi:MAG: YfjI family protein [Desulfobacterales bacterium]|nr:YfjI family protein [Desulfobacterales bacterium]
MSIENLDRDMDSALQELQNRIPSEGKNIEGKPPLDQLTIRGMAEQFADLFASRLESPWSFWAISFLTVLGAVVCDKVRLRSSLLTQPRLYSVILGESADDRKSEAIKQTVHFFKRFGLLGDLGLCYGVGSAEGLAEKLKEQKKVLLIFDELKTFVSKSSIEAAILLPAVNTLFEDTRFQSQTKTHAINIDGASLSILAASTVDTFTKMFSPIFTDIGFINRLWLTADKAERKFAIPEEIPYERQKTIAEKVNVCLYRFREETTIPMTDEARGIFEAWYMSEDSRGIHSKRLDTYGLRLMLIFAANEMAEEIGADIAERVIKLLFWQREIRGEHDPVGCENVVAKIEEQIRRMLKRRNFNTRELRQYAHGDRYGLYLFNSAKQNLLKEGEIKYDRKKDLWFVPNPVTIPGAKV